MIFWTLFMTFFKIGLFSFGGGYAMLPLIADEVLVHGWLSQTEFVQIIAVAEMTPGPIAVNSATYVGYQTAGFWGSFCATLGVAAPSVILILLVSRLFFKYNHHPLMKRFFTGVRPVIAGLVLTAVWFIPHSIWMHGNQTETGLTFLIAIMVYIMAKKTHIHPIILILSSGMLGIVCMALL